MRVLSSNSSIIGLDKKDKDILIELIVNPRLPLTKIAKKVLLSRKSVEYRKEQMEREGVITGYRTVINIRKLGYNSYHIFLTPNSPKDEKEIIDRAMRFPEVNAVVTYSGKYSVEISIMARTPEEYFEIYGRLSSGIMLHDDTTLLLLSTIKSAVMPDLQKKRKISEKNKEINNFIPDKTDLELLKILSKNATISMISLANQLKISKDTVSYRMKSLLASRHIIEFRPAINFSALGYSINSILIKVNQGSKNLSGLETYMKESDSILWSTKTFGQYDYLIYVITKDISDLHILINQIKIRFENAISSYELLFAYAELKYQFMADSVTLG